MPVIHHSVETLLPENQQLVADGTPFRDHHGGKHINALTFRSLHDETQHVFHIVAFHLLSAHRRKGVADAGEEKLQVFVNFRHGAHGRSGVPRQDLLLDSDGRRDARDGLHLGLFHASHELAGIRAETLHIAPLPLRIERIES